MAKREYKVVSYIMIGDNAPVRFDSLDDRTRAECRDKMLRNIGNALSSHYSAHTDELPRFIDQPSVSVKD